MDGFEIGFLGQHHRRRKRPGKWERRLYRHTKLERQYTGSEPRSRGSDGAAVASRRRADRLTSTCSNPRTSADSGTPAEQPTSR
jgi:hypothetical protein